AASRPFRSLQKAADRAEPGDTVLLADGIYPAPEDSDRNSNALVTLSKTGRPDAWITFKPAPGARPEIRPLGWNGILVTGSYYIFDGLAITGANDSIRLIDAIKEEKNPKPNPYYNTNGISIDGRKNPPDRKPHHVIVRNCVVSKMPGGGITMLEADYVTFEDNVVFGNCWFMRYGGSGITTNGNWAHDDAPGYHVIIQRNLVWDNKTLVPWSHIGKLSDGNGILLDVTDIKRTGPANPTAEAAAAADAAAAAEAAKPNAKPKSLRPEWKGRALIANNVSAYNGGSGIHVFRTQYVDIINNTTYWNGQIVNYEELFSNNSRDIVILNNIIVPAPAGRVTSNSRNGNVRWDYNLYPIAQKVVSGPNDIVAEPRFIKIDRDLRLADFRLQSGSSGLDSGSSAVPQATDLLGKKRFAGRGVDRGAYEQ
ncbi:MAG: right-handed parallel beta-helix repeat-containing protein, partial [Burkholderiales bacterium]|nr:right-handed parallel beta-helix repeat-containing protein [Opitutaceae bacterium]